MEGAVDDGAGELVGVVEGETLLEGGGVDGLDAVALGGADEEICGVVVGDGEGCCCCGVLCGGCFAVFVIIGVVVVIIS